MLVMPAVLMFGSQHCILNLRALYGTIKNLFKENMDVPVLFLIYNKLTVRNGISGTLLDIKNNKIFTR